MPRAKKLNLDQLLVKIVELLTRHSPQTLSFSKVSRLTGVPRSTLYYYFGSSREKMIAEAVRFGMQAFVQLTALERGEMKTWDRFQKDRLVRAVDIIRRYPWASGLYFRYRNDQSQLGENIRDTEAKYVAKLRERWSNFNGSPADVMATRCASYLKLGLFWGLAVDHAIWFDPKYAKQLDRMLEKVQKLTDEMMKTVLKD